MQFTYDHQQILSCVQAARRAAAGSTTLPILKHLLVEADETGLRVTGTDLETTVVASVPIVADSHGACCVPAEYFENYLESMPGKGETTFLVDKKGRLHVSGIDGKGAKCRMEFNTLRADEFPALPKIDEKNAVTFIMIAAEWNEFRCRAWYCPSRDDRRGHAVTTALLKSNGDTLIAATTDTQRLARLKVERLLPEFIALIPIDAVKLITALFVENTVAEVTVGSHGDQRLLVMRLPGITIWSRLVTSPYPAIERVIPPSDTPIRFTVDRKDFLASLKRVAPMARVVLGKVILTVDGDVLTTESAENEVGAARDSIAVSDGAPWAMSFLADFLIDAAEASGAERLSFAMQDEYKPVLIRDDDERWAAVIMPIVWQRKGLNDGNS